MWEINWAYTFAYFLAAVVGYMLGRLHQHSIDADERRLKIVCEKYFREVEDETKE